MTRRHWEELAELLNYACLNTSRGTGTYRLLQACLFAVLMELGDIPVRVASDTAA